VSAWMQGKDLAIRHSQAAPPVHRGSQHITGWDDDWFLSDPAWGFIFQNDSCSPGMGKGAYRTCFGQRGVLVNVQHVADLMSGSRPFGGQSRGAGRPDVEERPSPPAAWAGTIGPQGYHLIELRVAALLA